ncbi:hypothetical protein CALCODRAFT_72877 [Calocera cornea HHB12733]|uniref:Uncharacterized protein n=1 Tax=Calocera cornea HHB12733 TaxID=1353952 RepID=A0A165ITT3_9BASI|nr:hypothetical protein CALCODRAFT_72877 [Calocera cornea HHB12733]
MITLRSKFEQLSAARTRSMTSITAQLGGSQGSESRATPQMLERNRPVAAHSPRTDHVRKPDKPCAGAQTCVSHLFPVFTPPIPYRTRAYTLDFYSGYGGALRGGGVRLVALTGADDHCCTPSPGLPPEWQLRRCRPKPVRVPERTPYPLLPSRLAAPSPSTSLSSPRTPPVGRQLAVRTEGPRRCTTHSYPLQVVAGTGGRRPLGALSAFLPLVLYCSPFLATATAAPALFGVDFGVLVTHTSTICTLV